MEHLCDNPAPAMMGHLQHFSSSSAVKMLKVSYPQLDYHPSVLSRDRVWQCSKLQNSKEAICTTSLLVNIFYVYLFSTIDETVDLCLSANLTPGMVTGTAIVIKVAFNSRCLKPLRSIKPTQIISQDQDFDRETNFLEYFNSRSIQNFAVSKISVDCRP